MKLVLTGASGSIGRNFLIHAPGNWEIIAIYHTNHDFPRFVEALGKKHIIPLQCNLDSVDATG
ncbi:MAG TPA: hypothetical protein VMC08_02265, partial [Bacteroidales bacterium]|nr:hypothetical protein [Bacteroidales bacterium]